MSDSTDKGQSAHRGFKYYFNPLPRSATEAILWGGYTVDMVGTVKNVTHPQWYDGYNAANGVFYSKKGDFIEGGWAKFLGNRNAPAIVSANFLLDWGIVALNRRIGVKAETGSRRWKVISRVSNGLVLSKGLGHAAEWHPQLYLHKRMRLTVSKEAILAAVGEILHCLQHLMFL